MPLFATFLPLSSKINIYWYSKTPFGQKLFAIYVMLCIDFQLNWIRVLSDSSQRSELLTWLKVLEPSLSIDEHSKKIWKSSLTIIQKLLHKLIHLKHFSLIIICRSFEFWKNNWSSRLMQIQCIIISLMSFNIIIYWTEIYDPWAFEAWITIQYYHNNNNKWAKWVNDPENE